MFLVRNSFVRCSYAVVPVSHNQESSKLCEALSRSHRSTCYEIIFSLFRFPVKIILPASGTIDRTYVRLCVRIVIRKICSTMRMKIAKILTSNMLEELRKKSVENVVEMCGVTIDGLKGTLGW
jgi:hypothetical protein